MKLKDELSANEDVANMLRALRRQANLSQVDLADALGRSQSNISHIERGEVQISISIVAAWAQACQRVAVLDFENDGRWIATEVAEDYERHRGAEQVTVNEALITIIMLDEWAHLPDKKQRLILALLGRDPGGVRLDRG